MDGIALLRYVRRRLAEENLAVEADREGELYELLTEGRDRLLQTFAQVAPVVVARWLALVRDPSDPRRFTFPVTAADAYRVLAVRDAATGEALSAASTLAAADGAYVWDDARTLRVPPGVTAPDRLEVRLVPAGADLTDQTTEAQVGLPATCHRALAKWAVVLALTADEESDASVATGLFRDELQRLEELFGSYDAGQFAAALAAALTADV